MPDVHKTERLTIYLIKDNFANISDIIDAPSSLSRFLIPKDGSLGELYILPSYPRDPKWCGFFQPHVASEEFGKSSSTGALFALKHGGRIFALSFGTGRFCLKQDCWEDSFGLIVALNCIGTNTVKSIDKHSLDVLARHTREQASREATASEFGLDIEQDLLRAVTGTPGDPAIFGKWITGMDTLHLSIPVTIDSLPLLLDRIREKHQETSYRQNFPWVDQITEVRDSNRQSELNAALVARLRSGNRDNTWMAVPKIIDWEDVTGFRFPSARGPRTEFHDVHLEHFLNSIDDLNKIDEEVLKSRSVECFNAEPRSLYRWTAYNCLYTELDIEEESYLLSGGKWYRVRRDFVKEVNEAYAAIPDYEGILPEYDDASEGVYVRRVALGSPDTYALMDQKNIVYGGGHSKVEFCDLFASGRDLIHIKRYGQAAALSHLFAQGLTSGELFQTDSAFRKLVNATLPDAHRLYDPDKRPQQEEYRVVFAVVSDKPGPLVIPFFSRLNLKHAARRLGGYGFRVAKAKIVVNETRAKLQKIRSRKAA